MAPNVSQHWLAQFHDRMRQFEARNGQGVSLSVKVRVDNGCYCRNCCPAAHRQLDESLAKHLDRRWQEYVEHESGPEFLFFLGALTAGLSATAAIVNLITAVIRARTEGFKSGDKRSEPLTVVVRGIGADDKFFEREIVTVETTSPPKLTQVKDTLTEAIDLIAADRSIVDAPAPAKMEPPKRKRQSKKRRKK